MKEEIKVDGYVRPEDITEVESAVLLTSGGVEKMETDEVHLFITFSFIRP